MAARQGFGAFRSPPKTAAGHFRSPPNIAVDPPRFVAEATRNLNGSRRSLMSRLRLFGSVAPFESSVMLLPQLMLFDTNWDWISFLINIKFY